MEGPTVNRARIQHNEEHTAQVGSHVVPEDDILPP